MTKQSPDGRYLVISNHHLQEQGSANVVPAGRYDLLRDAIAHCGSVTFKMGVMDAKAESRGFIYRNWETPPTSTPWGQVQTSKRLAAGIQTQERSQVGGVFAIWWAGYLTNTIKGAKHDKQQTETYRSPMARLRQKHLAWVVTWDASVRRHEEVFLLWCHWHVRVVGCHWPSCGATSSNRIVCRRDSHRN